MPGPRPSATQPSVDPWWSRTRQRLLPGVTSLDARALRLIWRRALDEHATPRKIGLSIAVGVFVGCTPFLMLHGSLALGAATLLRLNRLWAFLGSRVSFTPILAWIAFGEIQIASRLLDGVWVSLAPSQVFGHARELFVDWLVGAGLVGAILGACAGLVAYAVARRAAPPASPEGV